MSGDDQRFSVSPEKYLEKHHVLQYMEDAITQLLEHKESNPKVNVTKFYSDYFTSVKEGNHVLFREYSYVRMTPHNRACFVRTFWKCFRNIGKKGDLLSVREYHSLLCLLCPDFPFTPVQKTARIILMEDAMDCLISFSDFLYAFQVQFCYDEFLSKCAEIYKELQNNPQVSPDTVVVPTSEENAAPVHTSNIGRGSTEGVEANLFYRLLVPVCEKLDKYAPAPTVLRELLSAANRVTFYGFLMAMAKCEALNRSIGKLPNKGELLEISDPELTSDSPVLAGIDILGRFPNPRPNSGTNKSRPVSAQLRPLSAGQGTNVTPGGAAPQGETKKPPTGAGRGAAAKQTRTASRRRQHVSSESDDDSSGSTTD